MPGTPTTRLSLPTINGATDDVSTYPAVNLAQMDALDGAILYSTGTLAARPASPTVAPQEYYATDMTLTYRWDGTKWRVCPNLAPARAYASGLNISSGWNLIQVGTASFDDESAFNLSLSAGYYVCPRTGKYAVSGQVVGASLATSGNFGAGIWGNSGAILSEGQLVPYAGPGGGTAVSVGAVVADIVSCTKNDIIGLAANTDHAMLETSVSPNINHISIQPLC